MSIISDMSELVSRHRYYCTQTGIAVLSKAHRNTRFAMHNPAWISDWAQQYNVQELFAGWVGLTVRLDVWHFMRRLARSCTSESHPLYGPFMAKLSMCIFEWDEKDLDVLLSARRAMMVQAGVVHPSPSALTNALTREEIARHCRRRTRGTQATTELIENLLLSLSTATDSLGVPLLRSEVSDIWKEQKRHISCLQDPPDIQLYTVIGHLQKGGVTLPVYRCARGSTSLESFHLHLARLMFFFPAQFTNLQSTQVHPRYFS